MRKIILLFIGISSFFLGCLLNFLITLYADYLFPFKTIGVLFLILWFFVGRFISNRSASQKTALLYLNTPAFTVLLLILFQSLILGHYGLPFIGTAAQLYYLPLTGLSSSILIMFRHFISTMSVNIAFIVAFLLMCGASYLGCFPKDVFAKS